MRDCFSVAILHHSTGINTTAGFDSLHVLPCMSFLPFIRCLANLHWTYTAPPCPANLPPLPTHPSLHPPPRVLEQGRPARNTRSEGWPLINLGALGTRFGPILRPHLTAQLSRREWRGEIGHAGRSRLTMLQPYAAGCKGRWTAGWLGRRGGEMHAGSAWLQPVFDGPSCGGSAGWVVNVVSGDLMEGRGNGEGSI